MKTKNEREQTRGIERRAYPVQLEVRSAASGGPATVEGDASVTETPFEMWDMFGSYSEVVRSGAFTRTLNASPQVQLLLNHGGLAMAYTKAGTLELSEDDTGLHMRAEVNPVRSDVQNMLTALTDGNVDEMSFAFRVTRQMWSPDFDQRDILEVDLHRGDVSVVNFGANPETSVSAMRALDLSRMPLAEARALQQRIEERIQVVVVDTDPDDDDDTVPCPDCGAMNDADAQFCDLCGASMTPAPSFQGSGIPLALARAQRDALAL
jgi:HK97 family phage prohead protease